MSNVPKHKLIVEAERIQSNANTLQDYLLQVLKKDEDFAQIDKEVEEILQTAQKLVNMLPEYMNPIPPIYNCYWRRGSESRKKRLEVIKWDIRTDPCEAETRKSKEILGEKRLARLKFTSPIILQLPSQTGCRLYRVPVDYPDLRTILSTIHNFYKAYEGSAVEPIRGDIPILREDIKVINESTKVWTMGNRTEFRRLTRADPGGSLWQLDLDDKQKERLH